MSCPIMALTYSFATTRKARRTNATVETRTARRCVRSSTSFSSSMACWKKVTVSNVGCTSQHKVCDSSQGNIIVYGPSASLGGTWYTVSPDDVEEIVTEHLVNGRIVERARNSERSVNFS